MAFPDVCYARPTLQMQATAVLKGFFCLFYFGFVWFGLVFWQVLLHTDEWKHPGNWQSRPWYNTNLQEYGRSCKKLMDRISINISLTQSLVPHKKGWATKRISEQFSYLYITEENVLKGIHFCSLQNEINIEWNAYVELEKVFIQHIND